MAVKSAKRFYIYALQSPTYHWLLWLLPTKVCMGGVLGSTAQRWTTRKTRDLSSDWSTGLRSVDTRHIRWSCFRGWTRTTGTAGWTPTSSGSIAMQIVSYDDFRLKAFEDCASYLNWLNLYRVPPCEACFTVHSSSASEGRNADLEGFMGLNPLHWCCTIVDYFSV